MRVFKLSSDGDCLGEIGMILLHKEYDVKDLEQKKIKTLTGISLRWFAKIKVEKFIHTKNGYAVEWIKDVYADWTTGTLYSMDGDCFSSPFLKIVETDEEPHCSIKDMIEKFEYGRGHEYEIGAE